MNLIGPRPIEVVTKGRKATYTARCLRPYCRWRNRISMSVESAENLYDWHMAAAHDPVKEQEWLDRGPLPPPGTGAICG